VFAFAIVDARDDAILGGCGINYIAWQPGFANVAYWVRTSRHGQGIATAAVRQLAKFGFDQLGLHRIVQRCRHVPADAIGERIDTFRSLVHLRADRGDDRSHRDRLAYVSIECAGDGQWRDPEAPGEVAELVQRQRGERLVVLSFEIAVLP
jgi:hypothetical protein